jgi:hypothetical protein
VGCLIFFLFTVPVLTCTLRRLISRSGWHERDEKGTSQYTCTIRADYGFEHEAKRRAATGTFGIAHFADSEERASGEESRRAARCAGEPRQRRARDSDRSRAAAREGKRQAGKRSGRGVGERGERASGGDAYTVSIVVVLLFSMTDTCEWERAGEGHGEWAGGQREWASKGSKRTARVAGAR